MLKALIATVAVLAPLTTALAQDYGQSTSQYPPGMNNSMASMSAVNVQSAQFMGVSPSTFAGANGGIQHGVGPSGGTNSSGVSAFSSLTTGGHGHHP
jgi:hypothetical protein